MINVVVVKIAIHVTRLIRWKQKYSVEVSFTGLIRTADITLLYQFVNVSEPYMLSNQTHLNLLMAILQLPQFTSNQFKFFICIHHFLTNKRFRFTIFGPNLNNYSDGAACALFLLLWAGSFTISKQMYPALSSTNIYYAIVNMNIKVNVTNYTSGLQFSSKKISSLRAAKLYNSSCSLSHQ